MGVGTILKRGLAGLASIALMFSLAGCITAENSLSQNDIANMKLTAVAVSFDPNSRVSTPDSEAAFAAAKGIPEGQMLNALQSSEYREFVRNRVTPKIKAGLEQQMASRLNGTRPVRIEIAVSSYYIPSVISSVLIGGDPSMNASVVLVDARTGAVLLTAPKVQAFVQTGHGILGTAIQAAVDNAMKQTSEDKLIASFTQDYTSWLTHGV